MGCCGSVQQPESIPLHASNEPLAIVTGGNKPLRPLKSYVKTRQSPSEILKLRETFWETQPTYSGVKEVWLTLRLACEAESIETAQAIVDSIQLVFPTGKFTDGCYDSLGNHYVIPEYCLGPLVLIYDEKPKETAEQLDENENVDSSQLFDIVCRLSNGADVSLQVAPSYTIRKLKELVAEKTSLSPEVLESSIVILFGKKYDSHLKIRDTAIDGSALVQVMILQP
jgi:predicted DNA-binding protein (MmcQ/YjbR family)